MADDERIDAPEPDPTEAERTEPDATEPDLTEPDPTKTDLPELDPELEAAAAGEDSERSVGELVLDVTERLTLLVREEIQLAKTEIAEKIGKIVKGSAAAALAALFVVLAFAMLMHTFAWLLNDLFFEGELWLGFLVSALIWLLLAAIAGGLAYRSMKAGAPPVPDMAIEEAKRTGETLGVGE